MCPDSSVTTFPVNNASRSQDKCLASSAELFPARTVRMSPREFAELCPDRSSVRTASQFPPAAAGLFPDSNVRASPDSSVSRSDNTSGLHLVSHYGH